MQKSLSHIRSDRRGATAMMFALTLVPIAIAIGVSVDYGRAITLQNSLQAAADAAATAAVVDPKNKASLGQLKKRAEDFLSDNLERNAPFGPKLDTSVTVGFDDEGRERVSQVTVKALIPTTFLGLIGVPAIDITVRSASAASLPFNNDFHFLIDTSDSMGLAATEEARTVMKAKSQENGGETCEFACHIKRGGKETLLKVARDAGVTLRIDVAKAGVRRIVGSAEERAARDGVVNNYSIASFNSVVEIVDEPTSNIKKLEEDIATLDLGVGVPTKLADTKWESVIPDYLVKLAEMEKKHGRARTDRFVVLVTDGLRSQDGGSGYDGKGRKLIRPVDLDQCEAIKSAGYRLAVIYTEYYDIPYNDWYNKHVKPIRTNLPVNLEKCATPGLFAHGDTPEEIDRAFDIIFQAIQTTPRITS